MEKYSYYNIIIPFHNGYYILYNSVAGFYCLLTSEMLDIISKYENKIAGLATDYPDIYAILRNNGCIQNDKIDEYQTVETIKLERRFNSYQYHIIINPTMDCNLGCWYCYENHLPNSAMDEKVTKSIINHLHLKHKKDPFKSLFISFFGGEPLLKEKIVLEIINEADLFCKLYNINLEIDFTTNCTVLSEDILDRLKEFNVSFQITLDGDKEKHNKVRHYKNSTVGTYDKILNNIKRITESLDNYIIRIRLNCDNKTLTNKTDILDSIDFLDRKRSVISIHRIWQVDEVSMDKGEVLQFIEIANRHNFKVDFMQLACLKENVCYSDLFNEVVINYNGSVFKCTAREFTDENRDGVLTCSGQIVWDINRISRRMFLTTPEICKGCKLFPACTGLCSQHLIESGEMKECRFLKDFTIEEYITINFQQRYLQNRSMIL